MPKANVVHALALAGCVGSAAPSPPPVTRPPGREVPVFPQDPAGFVNGAPFSLVAARGDVVLVETWHRH
jgi:hypothetical protein